jgi:hypothetical protein
MHGAPSIPFLKHAENTLPEWWHDPANRDVEHRSKGSITDSVLFTYRIAAPGGGYEQGSIDAWPQAHDKE